MDIEKVLELKSLIQAANQEDNTGYVVRFIAKNADLSNDDFRLKFEQDQADRAEAARVEQHRQEKVLNDLDGIPLDALQAKLVQLLGTSSDISLGTHSTDQNQGE